MSRDDQIRGILGSDIPDPDRFRRALEREEPTALEPVLPEFREVRVTSKVHAEGGFEREISVSGYEWDEAVKIAEQLDAEDYDIDLGELMGPAQ